MKTRTMFVLKPVGVFLSLFVATLSFANEEDWMLKTWDVMVDVNRAAQERVDVGAETKLKSFVLYEEASRLGDLELIDRSACLETVLDQGIVGGEIVRKLVKDCRTGDRRTNHRLSFVGRTKERLEPPTLEEAQKRVDLLERLQKIRQKRETEMGVEKMGGSSGGVERKAPSSTTGGVERHLQKCDE